MNSATTIRSRVAIGAGCPITYQVSCGAEADIRCGNSDGVLQLTFQADALREFLRVGAEALREMDARIDAIRAQAV